MYGEDADLAIRARKKGYSPVICPEAVFIHEGGKSSETTAEKAFLLFKGKASLVRIQWDGLARRLGLAFLATGTGLRAFLSQVLRLQENSNAQSWLSVWKKRHQWLPGYSKTKTL
jgi:GT2 family glycosyltransferase